MARAISFPITFPGLWGEDFGHFEETPSTQYLRVLLWDDYNKGTLLDEWTDDYTALTFTTQLHGGFGRCQMRIPMPLDRIWLYLNRENSPGRLRRPVIGVVLATSFMIQPTQETQTGQAAQVISPMRSSRKCSRANAQTSTATKRI